MKMTMYQEVGKLNPAYQIESENHNFKAVANKKFFLEKRKICLFNSNQKEIVNINENSPITPILGKIPIVNWFLSIPLTIQGQTSGDIKVKNSIVQAYFFANINTGQYSCFHHTGGLKGEMYSIFKDHLQIGMIKKHKKEEYNTHSYEAEFDDDTDVVINSLFLVLVDVLWASSDNKDGTVYQTSSEVSWGLDMKFGKKPDLNWKPKTGMNSYEVF